MKSRSLAYIDGTPCSTVIPSWASARSMRRGIRRDVGEIDDATRRAVRANRVDLACGQARVDRDRPGVEPGRREQRGDERRAILADDEHTVPAAYAESGEIGRATLDPRRQFAIGPDALAFAQRGSPGSARGLQRRD